MSKRNEPALADCGHLDGWGGHCMDRTCGNYVDDCVKHRNGGDPEADCTRW
jgi:hypothetical protein